MAAALLVRFASVETGLDAATLRDRLADWGPWAPLLYFGVVAVGVNLLIPFSVLITAAGFAFGWERAFLIGIPATAAAHMLGYWLSASLARDPVRRFLQRLGRDGMLVRAEERGSFELSFAARFLPVPVGVQNYLLGLARIPVGAYLAGSLAGALPWLLAYVRLGDALEEPLSSGFWMAVGIYLVLLFAAGLMRRRRAGVPVR